MRKFYKNAMGSIFEFAIDGSQDYLITDEYIAMTDEEIDRHIHPEKYLSDEEKSLIVRQQLPMLSKRQFSLYLYDHSLYDSVMTALDQNPRFKIEYETAKDLERMSLTVVAMAQLLGWADEQVDAMWTEALML